MWVFDTEVEADEREMACAGLGGLNYWISPAYIFREYILI